MTRRTYSLLTEEKHRYISMLMLEQMVNARRTYPVLLGGNSSFLEPILLTLLRDRQVAIRLGDYVPTDAGTKIVDALVGRYDEANKVFNLYRAVNIETGEFAYERYFDPEFSTRNDPERKLWKAYLEQDCFVDLRVAVVEYKLDNLRRTSSVSGALTPMDYVFMGLLADGRFDTQSDGWEFKLMLGSTFDEMLAICNTNIHYEELGIAPDGTPRIRNVIQAGSQLMYELAKQEAAEERRYERERAQHEAEECSTQQPGVGGTVTETVEIVETVEYMEVIPPYYGYYLADPYYLSPLWGVPLWVLLN